MSTRRTFDVGQHVIYRDTRYDASEEAEVLRLVPTKRDPRYVLRFVVTGKQQEVPGTRIHGLWKERRKVDLALDQELQMQYEVVEEPVLMAIERVFIALKLARFAETRWQPVHFMSVVHDVSGLREFGVDVTEILQHAVGFEDPDGTVTLSPKGTALLCQKAARANPEVIERAIEQERQKRADDDLQRLRVGQEPWGDIDQAEHDLLRSWVGHEALTLAERVQAAEQEVRRLTVLAARAITIVRDLGKTDEAARLDAELLAGRPGQ